MQVNAAVKLGEGTKVLNHLDSEQYVPMYCFLQRRSGSLDRPLNVQLYYASSFYPFHVLSKQNEWKLYNFQWSTFLAWFISYFYIRTVSFSCCYG